MKKCFLILLIPVLTFTACKNDQNETRKQFIDEATKLPSMHVAASDFSVDVPNGWTTKDTVVNGVTIYIMIAPSSDGKTTINILHEGMQDFSAKQYKEATITSMKSHIVGFELKEDGEIKVGDLKGMRFGYNMFGQLGKLNAISYTLMKDNVAYILTAVTPAGNLDKYKSTFDATARSFKLRSK